MLRVFSDGGENTLNLVAAFRARQGKKARTHRFGGAQQQFSEQFERNIQPKPDLFGQVLVALRVLHERRETVLGKAGAGVVGEFVEDLPVAAMQQHVGDVRADLRPGRDRQQMRLGFWYWRYR